MAKLGWKILTCPDNWWVKIITVNYLKRFNFLDIHPKNGDSGAWKAIIKARPLLLKEMRWIVGNGKHINFWNYNYQGNIDPTLTVADFILPSNDWNIDKLKFLAINIPLIDTTNTFVWGLHLMIGFQLNLL